MSFRPAGSRPAVLGCAVALVFALSASLAAAQDAKPAAASSAKPAAAASAAAPAAAEKPAAAEAAHSGVKLGDATAGQGKAAACGACHGMDGNSSDAQYPKLAGQSEQYIVQQLTNFKSGKRQNPIMMGMAAPLSEQDMHDIGAYFAGKSALPGVADQALVQRGEQLYRQGDAAKGVPACMACHSIDGRGNPGAMYPQLTSQHAQYIQATLKAMHDGTSWGDDAHAKIMPSIAQKLDEKDIAAVASYVEGLHATESAAAKPATP
ncbi:cytochrome c4 [Dyella sp. LX-66]|uniref:c-type cytochrome n=1 Tax=unclassified Dyella TaxID=2634549 RepID=UPI001BE02647|nr:MULTISPECIES: c-type cytochrome [unclassified Dyella]MBT2117428.1 cytochrome c4 [Dyella sp. LX-1]MBT2138492.1 cytochrome c4 [Dyella sp. LX-66]